MNVSPDINKLMQEIKSLNVNPIQIFVDDNIALIQGYQTMKGGAEQYAENQELVREIKDLKEKITHARAKENKVGYHSKNPPSSLLEFRLSDLQKTLYGTINEKHSGLLDAIKDLRRLLRDLGINASTNDVWKLIGSYIRDKETMTMGKSLEAKGTNDLGQLIDSFLSKYGENYLNEMKTFVRFLIKNGVEHPPEIVDIIVERYESKFKSESPTPP